MSTNCIVLGKNNPIEQVKKPIEFLVFVDTSEVMTKTKRCKVAKIKPNEFFNIELVNKAGCVGLDIMFAEVFLKGRIRSTS
jgi:capsular polysaccharide biosynthesis protein